MKKPVIVARICALSAFLLQLFFSPLIAAAAPIAPEFETTAPNSPKERLLAAARERTLSTDPQWLAFLHILPGSSKSEIDDPRFFLAPGGKYDSGAELEATISGLFEKGEEKESVQCRFPARYRWLRAALPIDPHDIPPLPCAGFADWEKAIDPHGISLIFPTALPNSPASAFGHTLLRIDSSGSGEDQRLTDYTASYAAETLGDDALSYAIKGTIGGYSGYFAVAPYYEKIKQYGDLENRDIWEYELAFSPAEVSTMVQHLWELQRIGLDYYYFDENCAYELLSLLTVARPELDLQSRFHGWIIPVDTVREIAAIPGLVKEKRFRPSAATVLVQRMNESPESDRAIAKEIVQRVRPLSTLDALPAERRANTLDLAYDFLTYSKIKARDETPEVRDLGYQILRARSATGVTSNPVSVPPPAPPEDGHGTMKLSAGFALNSDKPGYEIGIRPAYNDLLDPGAGYSTGSQIKFLDLGLRQESGRPFELSRLTVLDITSITARNEFLKPLSWQVNFGVERDRWSYERQPLLGHGLVRFGAALNPLDRVTAYAIAGPHFEAGPALPDGYAAGAGARSGIFTDPLEDIAVGVSGGWERFNAGDTFSRYDFGTEVRYYPGGDIALRARVTRRQDLNSPYTQTLLSIEWFP